jgi:hypothetical protein
MLEFNGLGHFSRVNFKTFPTKQFTISFWIKMNKFFLNVAISLSRFSSMQSILTLWKNGLHLELFNPGNLQVSRGQNISGTCH